MSPLDLKDVLERARGAARVGDHEETRRLLKGYIAQRPDDRDARLLLGSALAKSGKLDEAAAEFTTLAARNPRDVEALNNLAVIYRRQDKLQDALAVLLDAIDIDPTRAEFHYNIGNIHKQLDNLKAASMAYAKVVELDPSYVPAYNNLGTIYDRLKKWDQAFNMFRKGLALDRNNPTLHFNYGVALESTGHLDEAAAEYQAALRSRPGWVDAMNNLGIIYFKKGQHARAMDTFTRILNTDPFNAEARNNMGVVLGDQGRTKDAILQYRRALEADPKYVKAVANLERTLEDAGNLGDAVIELEKLIKLAPTSADVRTRLGSLYLKLERYPDALEQAKQALDWEPENIQALRIEGIACRMMGDDEKAKNNFEKILAVDPGNYSFQLDLADIHFKRKEYKEAEGRINAFLSRKPNDRNAKFLLGQLYAEMGNKTHAVQIFEELAKADPNDTDALAEAAALHKSSGEIEKALRTADKLVNLQGARATSDDLSELNESLAFYENAVNAYSSDVRDMWDRNLNLIRADVSNEEEGEGQDDSFLLGAVETAEMVDEETEELFIETSEDNDELIPEDETTDEPDERQELSLDALPEGPVYESPGGFSDAGRPFPSGDTSPSSPQTAPQDTSSVPPPAAPQGTPPVPPQTAPQDTAPPQAAPQETPPVPPRDTPQAPARPEYPPPRYPQPPKYPPPEYPQPPKYPPPETGGEAPGLDSAPDETLPEKAVPEEEAMPEEAAPESAV
ncbi:MAG: tetratricopeptide repeat protein, partial [Spirochaetaceae bacterium]|nr:tetratricopeptide repeat protein [Spirochaetaceae bacterium]